MNTGKLPGPNFRLRATLRVCVAGACLAPAFALAQAQESTQKPPDAPTPQTTTPATTPVNTPTAPPTVPCPAKSADANASTAPPAPDAQPTPCPTTAPLLARLDDLKNLPIVKQYTRFIDGPQANHLTPQQKGWLAVRDVADPFNTLTILGSSAISVASNSHSAYGPGFPGFGRYVGVSYTQDITAEFFGTFLIPSVVHQDPRYHRLPNAGMKRRIAHAAYQVLWTQSDDGKGMLNYADTLGFAIDDQIGNLYIPGRETRASATAQRYLSSLALAPVDNYITEFLPDIAKRIHVRVVFIQQIINQVANRGTTTNNQ